uniref:Uncharacterized protein n=1 Tax=Anguilla anguilla TaxID=7936 RepID=A0A0E9RMT7_ANGAN
MMMLFPLLPRDKEKQLVHEVNGDISLQNVAISDSIFKYHNILGFYSITLPFIVHVIYCEKQSALLHGLNFLW